MAEPSDPVTQEITRESAKHGPRMDESLAELSKRLTGQADATGLDAEGDETIPGEPAPPSRGARPSPVDDPTEGPMERARRDEIRELLAAAPFPADRNDLLRYLGPDERGPVQAHLRALPPDIVFGGPDEVVAAFGGIRSDE